MSGLVGERRSGAAGRVNGPWLTVGEMRPRDWRRLSDSLPLKPCHFGPETRDTFLHAIAWFSEMHGYMNRDHRPYGGERRAELHRRIWKALARPYRAGPFRVERTGREDFAFAITLEYAEERRIKRARRRRRIVVNHHGGFDAMFEADFQKRRLARASEQEREFQSGTDESDSVRA